MYHGFTLFLPHCTIKLILNINFGNSNKKTKGFLSVNLLKMVNLCFGLEVSEFGFMLDVPIIPQAGISFNPLGY